MAEQCAADLYVPEFEHDACGVAMVADLKGRRDHSIVRRALTALLRPRDLAERAVVAVGAGVALCIVVGQAMVVTTLWAPVAALVVLVVLSVPVLVRQAVDLDGRDVA